MLRPHNRFVLFLILVNTIFSFLILILNSGTILKVNYKGTSAMIVISMRNSSVLSIEPDVFLDETRQNTLPTVNENIYIAVKTCKNYHSTRVKLLIKTWIPQVKKQVYLFSDEFDQEVTKFVGEEHLIKTNCPPKHDREGLCCKMRAELQAYINGYKDKRWFCHFDDDCYVNVPILISTLGKFNHSDRFYIGRPSLDHPLEVRDYRSAKQKPIQFWFGTGGAGMCLSQALMNSMEPFIHEFVDICNKIASPDDVTLGFISEILLQTPITTSPLMNSHLHGLGRITREDLPKQISVSYRRKGNDNNIIKIPDGIFNETVDNSRFLSYHCMLYPQTQWCHHPDRIP